MIKLIHCADLHLSMEEKEYSLSVLSEIVALTMEHEAAFLIMAGDIFNSFTDCESLRAVFRREIGILAGRCRVLFLPGNHEHLKKGNKSLWNLDLGDIILLDREPFDYRSYEKVEFISIPDQAGYRDYRRWNISPRTAKARILIAHGTVAGLSYSGPEGESGGAVLAADIFRYCRADYGALGHIHSRRASEVDGCILAYPGSARVWRRGESGARGLHIITIDQGIDFEFVTLESAGRYREYQVPLGLEAEVDQKCMERDSWQPADWIRLNFSGIVENEHDVRLLEEKLQQAYGKRVRRLEVDRNRVAVLQGIASQPLAAAFLKGWQEKQPPSPRTVTAPAGTSHPTGTTPEQSPAQPPTQPSPEHADYARKVWLRAREIGLRELKRVLEARD